MRNCETVKERVKGAGEIGREESGEMKRERDGRGKSEKEVMK